MAWLLYAMCAVALFATQDLLMRVLGIKSSHSRACSLVFNSWATLFVAIVFLFQRNTFAELAHLPVYTYILIACVVVLYGLYERFQFIARKNVEASSLSVFFTFSHVIGFLGALLFLGEEVTIGKGIGAMLTISASYMLIYKNPTFRITRPLVIAFVEAILLGLTFVINKPASAELPIPVYSLLVWGLPLSIIAFPYIEKNQLVKEFRVGGWHIALAALLNVAGFFAMIQAFALTDASNVIPVISTSGIFTVLGGILFLKERDHIVRKIIAATIACIGIILLS